MRIVHVCLSGPFYEGYAYQDNILPKYHKKLGHDTIIVAPTFSRFNNDTRCIEQEKPGETILKEGIRLIRIPAVFSYRIHQHFHLYRGLGRTIKALEPDFLFIHSVACLNYRFFALYGKNHPNVKIVFDNHADFENSCHNWLSYWYSHYLIRYLVINKVKDVVVKFYGVTPARCAFLRDVYGAPTDRIALLPMGADDDQMNLSEKSSLRQLVRKKYRINEDDFLIVTGGKIDYKKNIHVLAEAVARSKFKKIKLLIFGSIIDELKDTFIHLASDRVQHIGWQPANDVYKYFYAADIVVFPGSHSVLWEQAAAAQVPLAVNWIKGFEHVNFNDNCILMKEKSVDYYQALIESLYTNKVFYTQLFINAHSEESTQFLYSRIAQKILNDVFI